MCRPYVFEVYFDLKRLQYVPNFFRYEKKMSVSKCEKFGYGVLVSQISSTKPGMEAIYQTGLIQYFINDIWNLLESNRPFGDPHVS